MRHKAVLCIFYVHFIYTLVNQQLIKYGMLLMRSKSDAEA